MHVGVFEANDSVTYAGDGVVEERVSLLEGFEFLCRDGLLFTSTCVGVGSAVAVRTDNTKPLQAIPGWKRRWQRPLLSCCYFGHT